MILLFSIAITLLYSIFELPLNLSILQLCEYNYLDYVKTKYKNYKLFYLKIIFDINCLVLQLLKLNLIGLIIYVAFYFFFCPCYMMKIKIKKHIFTKRIIRFYCVFVLCVLLTKTYEILSQIYINMYNILVFVTITPVIMFIITHITILIIELFLIKKYIRKAKDKLNNSNAKIIAITGSYGKTSVKNFLYTLLSEKHNVVMTPKSYNTISGICLTINNTSLAGVDYVILEMGAKKRGDVKKLCKLFSPYYGILTSIGEQHLKTFRSIENIYSAKTELQDAVSLNGFMVFNCYNDLANKACVSYLGNSKGVGVDYFIADFKQNENGISFLFKTNNYSIPVNVPLYGYHNAINISLAITFCLNIGFKSQDIIAGLENIVPVESRLKPYRLRDNLIFNNGYNSNPHSATCSLEVISSFESYHKIIITPGFVEMGKMAFELNYNFGKQIAGVCNEAYIVNQVNRKSLVEGIMSVDSNFKIHIVEHFQDIDFNNFKQSVILIENDLPSNYI